MSSFTEKLRAALSSFDASQLAWVAGGFAAERYVDEPAALAELVSLVEEADALNLNEALRSDANKGPFECFILAALAKHAGVGADVRHDGVLTDLPAAVAGDLIVNGPLVCTIENWLLVAGNVKADMLIVSADVIVAGDLEVRDGIIGVNSHNQSMWVRGPVKAPVLITEDYSLEVDATSTELSDESADELLAPGVADETRTWLSDGGPDEVVNRLLERIENGLPVFRKG